jgi:uncharacterized protein
MSNVSFFAAPDARELESKNQKLRELLRAMNRALIAFSGGVDSAFLLTVARQELGERAQAFIGVSPSLMPAELEEARELALQIGAPLREIETHEMDDPNYASNPNNRCYFCKSELYDVLNRVAQDEEFDTVCDGTNIDDLTEWRPGAQAGSERAIRSPLREAGLNKAEIRVLSRQLNLPTWDKPAMPCLSSRIPYGTPVTREALQMIGKGEAFLRERGLREVRVRHYVENEKPTARLEIAPDELPQIFAFYEAAAAYLKSLGYAAVLLDLEGYRRGRLNAAITTEQIKLQIQPRENIQSDARPMNAAIG